MKIYRFKIFGHDYETKILRRDGEEVRISVNGQEYNVQLEPSKKTGEAHATPKVVRPKVAPETGTKVTAEPASSVGAGVMKAPMPGLVLKVSVKTGGEVKVGQTVLIMEAMKMQNQVQATKDGKISKISVAEGDSVLEGQELLVIE